MTFLGKGFAKKPTIQAFFISLGVFFEWYDFTLYFYLGSILSSVFFNGTTDSNNQSLYYAIFAIAYICRPIGGIIFGRLADRYGRRHALLLAMKCMFIASLGMALLPTYAHLGITASILMLLFRALQGISIGGEYTGVLTLVFEGSKTHHEGKYLSMIGVISCLGQMASACFLFLMMHFTSHAFMIHIGWRICFLVGAAGMAVVYYFQSTVPESQSFLDAQQQGKLTQKPILYTLQHHRLSLTLVFLLTGTLGIAYILYFVSIPNELIHRDPLNQTKIHWTIIMATALQTLCYPLGGWLSDKIQSTRMLLILFTLTLLTLFPCNDYLMRHFLSGGFIIYLGFIAIFSIATPAFLLLINQRFPVHCRASGVFVGYNIANALFCSITPSVGIIFSDGTFSMSILSGFLIAFLSLCVLVLLISQSAINKQTSKQNSRSEKSLLEGLDNAKPINI